MRHGIVYRYIYIISLDCCQNIVLATVATVITTIVVTTFVLNCCQNCQPYSTETVCKSGRENKKRKFRTPNGGLVGFMFMSLDSCIFSAVSVDVDEVVDKFMFTANLVELF